MTNYEYFIQEEIGWVGAQSIEFKNHIQIDQHALHVHYQFYGHYNSLHIFSILDIIR